MAKEAPAPALTEDLFGVIVRPLLTERSTLAKEKHNQYAFEVALAADKRRVARAVKALFKVDVESVRTMIVPGKFRRYGRGGGMSPDWKKAVVTVAKGQKIEIAEQSA